MLCGDGGSCFVNNIFLALLLCSLWLRGVLSFVWRCGASTEALRFEALRLCFL